MTQFNRRIENFVAGDDLEVVRTVTGVPDSTTIDAGWLTVKLVATDPDVSAVFQKSITSVESAAQGHISDTGADGTGEVKFYLANTDTALLTGGVAYSYDIKIKLDTNRVYRVEVGVMVAVQGVTVVSA